MIDESIKNIKLPLQELKVLINYFKNKDLENLMINDNWNLNKTIAHLIGWAEQFKNEIKFLIGNDNESFPWFISAKNNWFAFNTKNIDKYADNSIEELINTFEQINKDIIDLLNANKDSGKLTIKNDIKYYGDYSPITILQMIKMKSQHELEHLKEIKHKIEKLSN